MRSQPLFALALILALSAPVYMWGICYPVHGLPFGLPGTAIMIVVPAIVASVMSYQEGGRAALLALWRQLFALDRIKPPWLALALGTMPAASFVAFLAMWALDLPLPEHTTIDAALIPFAFLLYFAGGALEEIGWTGYATPPLQERFGIVGAGIIIGGVWAVWHLVPWSIIQGHPMHWLAGQTLLTILMRIVMGWIYAYGGRSLFLAIVFHAAINVSYSFFPNGGSHYDPVVQSLVLCLGMLTWAAWAFGRYR